MVHVLLQLIQYIILLSVILLDGFTFFTDCAFSAEDSYSTRENKAQLDKGSNLWHMYEVDALIDWATSLRNILLTTTISYHNYEDWNLFKYVKFTVFFTVFIVTEVKQDHKQHSDVS